MLGPSAILNAAVLIVDDEEANVLLLQRMLAGAGYVSVTSTMNPAEVCELHRKNRYDLILLDIQMPGMDGFQVMEGLKEIETNSYLPVLAITARPDHKLRALKAGARDFLARPIDLAEVLMRVHNILEVRLLQREAETRTEQVKEECSRLAAIIEYSDEAIVSKTVDGIVIGWNHGAEKQYGYTAEEMIGRNTSILFPPDHYQEYLRIMRQVRNGEAVPSFDTVRRRKDGSLINVSVGFTPIETREGDVVGSSKYSHDITRLKKLEAQFIEAQKMEVVGHLASGLAHDFNNILVVIMGYSDLLALELGPENPLGKYTVEIRHASDRAAGLTRQLLIFSRKQTVQLVVLNLNEVVGELEKMLRRLIDENIEMRIVPGIQIGRIKTDAGYLGQVLMNLIVNARDAMPDGGKLTIATSNTMLDEDYARTHPGIVSGNYVMLSVSDTGTGMTAEVKAHLFEAFFTTKPTGKGTGLGLATCQTIVQQSGGHIDVDSEVGQGANFKIYFPQVEQPLETASNPVNPTASLPRGAETVLVVEDEPSLRQLTCGILKAQGYEVLSASHGQDALQVAREHKGSPIHLVVTDVIMPHMGGKVMAEWLKTTYPDLKILFTSGYTDDAITHNGDTMEAGVKFLSKPYTPTMLVNKVRALLDNELIPSKNAAINHALTAYETRDNKSIHR
jgi:PAS domain S-box-containing protein